MAAQNYKVLLFLLLSACSNANDLSVEIENSLSNCIKVDSSKIHYQLTVPLVKIGYTLNKHLSECGCKSAMAEFSSTLKMDGYNSMLLSGKFIFPESGAVYLPVSTSKIIVGDYKPILQLSCSMAD